jgi:hypothetical protein
MRPGWYKDRDFIVIISCQVILPGCMTAMIWICDNPAGLAFNPIGAGTEKILFILVSPCFYTRDRQNCKRGRLVTGPPLDYIDQLGKL